MEMLSVKEAAKLAGVSIPTIRSWYRNGTLRDVEHDGGGRCLIPKEEIDHILNVRKMDRDIRKMLRPAEADETLDKALDQFLNDNKE